MLVSRADPYDFPVKFSTARTLRRPHSAGRGKAEVERDAESKYCVDYFVHNWDTYSYKLAFSESLLLLWHLKKALFLGPVNVEAAQYLSTI